MQEFSQEDYVSDRVERMMMSLDRIYSNPEFTPEMRKEETNRMLTWHIVRTLNDQKSQIKFVIARKAPELASAVNVIISYFKMRLLENKSLKRE